MKRDLAPLAIQFALIACVASTSSVTGQILYSESFDTEEAAKVSELIDEFCFVDYIDYSSFTLGDSGDQTIAEAPNMIEGSAATRGVMLRCNVEEGVGGAINLLLTDEREGSQVQFTENYRMTFDSWMNLDEFSDRLSGGTTEVTVWGVGNDGAVTHGRITRTNPDIVGTWGWLAGDGGFGTEDSMFRIGATEIERKNDGPTTNIGSDPLFLEAFPDAAPLTAAPANSWVSVEVVVRNGTVTVSYNGVLFHRSESDQTDGGAFVGYEDPFNSLSWSPDFQFAIFDNIVVEQIGSGTLILTSDSAVGTVRGDEGNLAEWTIKNDNTEDLVITEGNLSGTDIAAFTVITEFPLMIAPGETGKLQVQFLPEAPNGEKTATLTLLSNDPTEPELALDLVGTRAVAEPLMAHFKLDDAEGAPTMEDASGLGTLGTYNAGPDDPVNYERPSLIGGDGTSIGFVAASSPGVGNFGQLLPLHTPTMSVSMWIKPELIEGEHTLFNRDPAFTGTDTIYGAIVGGDGSVIFRAGGELVLQTDPDLIVADEVYHIVVTHLDEDGFGNATAERTRLYINGALIAEATDDETIGFDDYTPNARITTMFLASKTAAGFGYTGDIDDVQIYSIELSEEEVAGMFGSPGATAFSIPDPIDFSITDVAIVADTGAVTVTWNSLPGKGYLLEWSTDLSNWDEVSDGIESGGASTSFVDEDAPVGTPVRYYRVTEE